MREVREQPQPLRDHANEEQLGAILCEQATKRIDSRRLDRLKHPSCALLRAPALTLLPSRKARHLDERPGRSRCFTRGCPGTFLYNSSLAEWDDGRCWSISITGYSPHGHRSRELANQAKAKADKQKLLNKQRREIRDMRVAQARDLMAKMNSASSRVVGLRGASPPEAPAGIRRRAIVGHRNQKG